MALFKRLESTVTSVTRFLALIGLAALLALALATVLDVMLRWLFNSPIVGLNDTYSLFMALIIASSFPLCFARRGNITIRFIGNALGPRARDVLDAFGNLVAFVIFSLMAWQLWLYTNTVARDGETTWILGWPVSPWWRVVTILIIICVPVTLVTVIQLAKSARKSKDIDDQSVASSANQE